MANGRRRKGMRQAEAAVVAAALRYKRARLAGDEACVLEEQGEEQPARSSNSWYEEASEHEKALFDALDVLDPSRTDESAGAKAD